VEPLPETVEALRELTRDGDTTLARRLWGLSRAVEEVVPDIVGLSLSFVEEHLTFTMTATSSLVAELDGVQYIDGGPCEETLRTGQTSTYSADDADDEERWRLFGVATAAAGILSTLSLPILRNDVVFAGVNLYAGTADAFEARHEQLADICGAWAGGAVTNADLDFTTRFAAAEAPERIRAEQLVDQAVGALISRSDVTLGDAEDRLRDAARRAGISDAQMARAILAILIGPAAEA
jgi:GAF domain-containing protein